MMWAYPREFTNADAASQVSGSPNRFTTISGPSHLLFLTQGYAVLNDPAMPIVGPGETANERADREQNGDAEDEEPPGGEGARGACRGEVEGMEQPIGAAGLRRRAHQSNRSRAGRRVRSQIAAAPKRPPMTVS